MTLIFSPCNKNFTVSVPLESMIHH